MKCHANESKWTAERVCVCVCVKDGFNAMPHVEHQL